MTELLMKTLIVAICLSVALPNFLGCASKGQLVVDVKTASDSILTAQDSVARARGEAASEYASQEFAVAESFLNEAQAFLQKGKNRETVDLASRADIEARIAASLAREAKARRRSEEIRESWINLLWEAKTDDAAAASARQAIAERKALAAQKNAEESKAWADNQVKRAEAELAIAKAELELGAAERDKAPQYAKELYAKAKSSLQEARAALASGDFQKATKDTEQAAKDAVSALVQARAKSEALNSEALRNRERAVIAIAKAELTLEQAKESLALKYAKSIYEKSYGALKDAIAALEVGEYARAESLANQARASASGALAVGETKHREAQEQEVLEDIKASALDAIARAERSLTQGDEVRAAELAPDNYKQAQTALDKANQALAGNRFEEVLSLVRESIAHSTTAIVMAEAKIKQEKERERIENDIIKDVEGLSESSARRTERGVVISMGGNLFSSGGSNIRQEVYSRLKALADTLKKYPNHKVIIEGHTDSVGSEEANLKISSERAQNFLRHLADHEQIPLERLSSVGYGESRPIASNENEAGRRQNRRVDIVILTAPASP